jgi:predicted ATPase/DNA-binding CsgD family transcriptional regulator
MRSRSSGGNLPVEVASFVGRRHEVSEVKGLLSVARLVTLTGVAGVGKTRLAQRVAFEVRRKFPDGVWFIELAKVDDPGLLAPVVGAALGIAESQHRPHLSMLAEYLADKRLLLVLDNAEHLLDACATLSHKLLGVARGLRILVTSRQVLHVQGEHVLLVRPLPVPRPGRPLPLPGNHDAAVRLFIDRAAAVVPGFMLNAGNWKAVATLCRRLEGIPLAIELSAMRLRALSVEQILDRLADRFRLLTKGSRTAFPRHRTLAAAIDWSFELCSAAEQLLWAQVAVFAGEFDLEAAEFVCSDTIAREDVLDLVTGLVHKSVLTRQSSTHGGKARYRMLDTLREYGLTKLSSLEQETAVRTRHRDYYRQLAAQAETGWFGPRQVEWLRRIRCEQGNFQVAVEFCLDVPGQARVAMEIVAGLRTFWTALGSLYSARRLLERAFALDKEPTAVRARALCGYAYIAIELSDLGQARAALDEAGALATNLADASTLALVMQYSSLVAEHEGDIEASLALGDRALTGYRERGDLAGMSATLFQMSRMAALVNHLRSAELCREFMALCDAHGAEWSRTYALWVIGVGKWRQGDRLEATVAIRDALRMQRSFGELRGSAAYCLEMLAWAAAREGQSQQAARLLGAATAASRRPSPWPTVRGYLRAEHTRCVERARTALGEERFLVGFRQGIELNVDQATDYVLQERAEPSPPARHARPAVLTTREHQVTELVGRGLSNKDIAADLVISQRTAEGHVQRILAKLGLTSRTQLATWVTHRQNA